MNHKISIKNADVFDKYLRGLSRFVNEAEFNIDKNGCSVYSINESLTCRLIYTTNSITCDVPINFAINSINKFNKAYQIFISYNPECCQLIYDDTYIRTDNKLTSSFKIQTVRRDIVEKYISKPLKNKLTENSSVVITNNKLKEILGLFFIDDNSEYSVYLYRKNNVIIADVDNKRIDMSENITIPIQNDQRYIRGDWTTPVIITSDSLRSFNLINADEVKLIYTQEQVLEVLTDDDTNDDGYGIHQQLIVSILEG